MSKLDEILDDLNTTVNHAFKEYEARRKQQIKILILDLLAESLKESDGNVLTLADRFTERVKGL